MKNTGTPIIYPYDIIAAIAEQFWQDRTAFGVAAMEPRWECAFTSYGQDLRNMSLVHRSWTLPARNVLRRRAVVPFSRMTKFLLSPFCGPWVREMILYWSINVKPRGVSQGDIETLEAILSRTPNLKILSLNTFLVYLPFKVGRCLAVITNNSPRLEELGIRHFEEIGKGMRTHVQKTFYEIEKGLQWQLPNMRSIKLLALRRSFGLDEDPKELDLNPITVLEMLGIDTPE